MNAQRQNVSADQIAARQQWMDAAFPSACHPIDSALLAAIEALGKNRAQKADAHVVAVSVAASAPVIVTYNLRDFPLSIVGRFGLRVRTPARFCLDLMADDPEPVLAGVRDHWTALDATPAAYLQDLCAHGTGMRAFAAALRACAGKDDTIDPGNR